MDSALRKILTASKEALLKREADWKRARERKSGPRGISNHEVRTPRMNSWLPVWTNISLTAFRLFSMNL